MTTSRTEGVGSSPPSTTRAAGERATAPGRAMIFGTGLIGGSVLDIYSSGLALLTLGVQIPRYAAALIGRASCRERVFVGV